MTMDALEIEGRSFETSILYWIGLLEELANISFAQEMEQPKSVVGRWRALSILSEKDGLAISALANESLIERTALSRMLDAMEADELVERRPLKDDRRTIEVYITRKGRALFNKMLPVRRKVFEQAARGMSEEELVTLITSIKKLVQNLSDDLNMPRST